MARVGVKSYDKNPRGKWCEPRHKRRGKAAAKRAERAFEKAVRRAGKAACKEGE